MSRALLTIRSDTDRARAISWAKQAPVGTRLEWKAPRRSIPQSDKMWACLSDVARQLPWHGMKLSANDWKLLFLDALNREYHMARMIPNIEGDGFTLLGRSSSDLSKDEMSQLIELIIAFGTQHGVKFNDEQAA